MDEKDINQTPVNENEAENNTDEINPAGQTDIQADEDFKFLGNPVATPEKQKSTSTLKKLGPVIALCAVAVLLFGSVFLLKHVLPDNTDTPTIDEPETGIKIFELSGSSADRMEIENSNDKFAFVKKVEKTYVIEGKESLPVANSSILSALTYFGSLSADSEVEKGVTDFEQYGLNDPVAKVTWTKGSTVHFFELGTIAPSGGYYMRVDGGDTVYTYNATSAKYFLSPRMDFYSTALFDYDESTDASYINHFTIKNYGKTTLDVILQDLTDESLNSAYLILEPIQHNFSADKASLLTSLLTTLTSCTVYDDDISAQNLAKYGLDNPEYTFSYTNVGTVNTAYFGNLSPEGYRYMYADGHDFVYIVDNDNINFLTHDVAYYCEGMSYTRSYDTIDSITISGGGKKYDISITGTADNNDLKAYINNKYVEYDSFATLYAHIISIDIKEVGEKKPDDELILTITVNCLDGSKDVLKYYKQSDLNTYYELNGKGMLLLPTSKVEQVLEFAQKLYDGEEIILDW